MKTKRFLAILLCVLMLGNLLSASAFAEEEQICTVIWLNGDGKMLDSKEYLLSYVIEYVNGNAEAPSTAKIPTKAADDNYTYDFAGWGEGEWYEDPTTTTYTFTPSFNSVPIKKHTLKISYVYEDGKTASESYTEQLKEGASYSVVSPTIENYKPDRATVSGRMGTSDVNEKVTYKATKVVVPEKAAKIEFSKASYKTTYNTSIKIEVVIKDQNGQVMKDKEVVCKIEKTTKKAITDSNGWARFGTNAGLIPAIYPVKVECDGVSATARLNVGKVTTKLAAKEKTFKSSTKVKKYTAILKDSKGKGIKGLKLILKVNKKKYIAKTNKKGKATFKIKKLTKKRKYTASIMFQGDKYYKKVTKKVKIIVK